MDHRVQELTQYISALRRYAMALIGNTWEADDLVQETLRRVISRLRRSGDSRRIENLRGYLFSALYNVHVDACTRDLGRRRHVALDDVAHLLSTPENQAIAVELGELSAALEHLPIRQREVVLLVALEGRSYKEAAEALGVPLGTVMSRLHRGREALRDALAAPVPRRLRPIEVHAESRGVA